MSLRLAPIIHIGNYRLSFTLLSLYCFETSTGEQMSVSGGDLRSLRAILRACLIPNHPDITEAQAGAAFAAADLPHVFAEISCLINSSLPPPRSFVADSGATAGASTDWHRTWAMGRYDLRLSEEEFWGMTPLMWDTLVRRACAANGEAEAELTMEERSKRILAKVEMVNEAWGGRDLRKR